VSKPQQLLHQYLQELGSGWLLFDFDRPGALYVPLNFHVRAKHEEDGTDDCIDIVGKNQRGELAMKGMATVHLLSRNLNYRVALTGADINLELPTVR
jgi:hypothetical protein